MRPNRHAGWFLLVLLVIGCARNDAASDVASPIAVLAPRADRFAIDEVDDEHDLTAGVTTLPAGIEILHEREEPKAGYFYAELPGGSQALALQRLKALCAELRVPVGDQVLFGAPTRLGVRTYLVKGAAVLDASGIRGAMAVAATGDEWGVALTFVPDALQSLAVALSQPGRHFRLVVEGLVEKDLFELLDEHSSGPIAGPHGSLSTKDWICSDHRALLTMSARNGVSSKARAASLAQVLPPFRDARECRDERTMPGPFDKPRTGR